MLGTVEEGGALTEDITADGITTDTGSSPGGKYLSKSLSATTEYELCTTTDTYAAGSLAVGVAFLGAREVFGDSVKYRLYMDGVQMAESGFIVVNGSVMVLVATKALSGSTIVKGTVYNYSGSTRTLQYGIAGGGGAPAPCPAAVGIGSIKT